MCFGSSATSFEKKTFVKLNHFEKLVIEVVSIFNKAKHALQKELISSEMAKNST